MDILALLIIVVVACGIMYFFEDSRQVGKFVIAVAALVWFLTVCGVLPNRVHFH
jgi:hypothetical protein